MALNKLTTKMTEQEARATQNQNNLHLLASEGTVDEQTIFDELAKKTSESSGAELIGVSPIDGIEGDTAQAVLGSINTQLGQKAPLTALSAAISAHNTDTTAHGDIREKIGADISSHNASGEAHKNIQRNLEKYATDKDTEVLQSAKEYADIKAAAAQSLLESHNASTTAHSDIRDKIALLQKYPCYEYATSGGAAQRFDDVSVIPHTIGVTVHGATDESGNSVTNPTVSVYGKNLGFWQNVLIKNGYTFNNSHCDILNPITSYSTVSGINYTRISSGTYTISVNIIGNVVYGSDDKKMLIYYKLNGENKYLTMRNENDVNVTLKSTFTIDSQSTFSIERVWFPTTPTSADLSIDIQLEVGDTATEYEPYTEPQTVTVPMTFPADQVAEIGVLNAVSPTMTVVATDDNALVSVVDVTYNKDIGKALGNLQAAIAALV